MGFTPIYMDIFYTFWLVVSCLQLFFWGLFFQRLVWQKMKLNAAKFKKPAVSIIICARNEAANLQKNLESILQQDYPLFEIIIVDDASNDETRSVVHRLQAKYNYLKLLRVKQKQQMGKKQALRLGIQSSQYDWLLLTDADCWPSSNQWVNKMMQQAQQDQNSMVLGYGPSWPCPSFLSFWVRYETMLTAIQYFSSAIWKIPYMGVGRNIMYKKSEYGKFLNFDKHQDLTAGDDDLFVNEAAKANDLSLCIDSESFMYSMPPAGWLDLVRQKRRHYSVSHRYQLKHKLLLATISGSHFLHYIGIFVFIGSNIWNFNFLVIIMMRLLLVVQVFLQFMYKTKQRRFFGFIFLFDALLPFYYLFFAPALQTKQIKKWK